MMYKFICLFFPVAFIGFLFLYRTGRSQWTKAWLVAASLAFYSVGQPMGIVRVVHANFRVGSVIHYFDAAFLQHADEFKLVFHASVVVANPNFHSLLFFLGVGPSEGGNVLQVSQVLTGIYAQNRFVVLDKVVVTGIVGIVVANLDGFGHGGKGDFRAVV